MLHAFLLGTAETSADVGMWAFSKVQLVSAANIHVKAAANVVKTKASTLRNTMIRQSAKKQVPQVWIKLVRGI